MLPLLGCLCEFMRCVLLAVITYSCIWYDVLVCSWILAYLCCTCVCVAVRFDSGLIVV